MEHLEPNENVRVFKYQHHVRTLLCGTMGAIQKLEGLTDESVTELFSTMCDCWTQQNGVLYLNVTDYTEVELRERFDSIPPI
jgi:hypothetical protein